MATGDLSGFKTYEDWQRANRAAGGGGESAEVRAHYFPPAPTAAPAAPAPAPRPSGGVTGRGGAPAPQPTGPAPAPAPSAPDMSGFQGADGYIRWAQANRAAGGTGDRAAFDQQMGAWQGGGAGGGSGPAGAGPRGTAQPLNTQLGNGNTIEQQFAAQRANVDYRDPSYSQAQWGAWEEEERKRVESGQSANQTPNKYNPDGKGCPPDKPFTSRPGPDGGVECAAKPDDCPDGSGLHGSKCVGNDWLNANLGGDRPSEAEMGASWSKGGGGGGGAAGGGAAAGAAGGGGSTAGGGDFAQMLETKLKGLMGDSGSRYNDKAMQGLLAQIKQRIESSKGTQVRQAQEEAAARGMSRSGRTGTNLAAIRRGAESQFTQEYGTALRAKIDADRQDKLDAIDRSQKYLDSLRDELYRRDMSAIQRQQFQANLDLAYANIAEQRRALASQQQYGKDMLAAQVGYGSVFGG